MEQDKNFSKFYEYIGLRQDIDAVDKILLTKIISLSKSKQGCYITNKSLGVYASIKHIASISMRLNKLEEKGFIKIHYHDKKRYITPLTLKDNLPLRDDVTPLTSQRNPPLREDVSNKINDNIIDKITKLDNNTSIDTGLINLMEGLKKEINQYPGAIILIKKQLEDNISRTKEDRMRLRAIEELKRVEPNLFK
jgi:hypothetical protein